MQDLKCDLRKGSDYPHELCYGVNLKHISALLKKKKKVDDEEENWGVARNCKSTQDICSHFLRKEQLLFVLQHELEMKYTPSR